MAMALAVAKAVAMAMAMAIAMATATAMAMAMAMVTTRSVLGKSLHENVESLKCHFLHGLCLHTDGRWGLASASGHVQTQQWPCS